MGQYYADNNNEPSAPSDFQESSKIEKGHPLPFCQREATVTVITSKIVTP